MEYNEIAYNFLFVKIGICINFQIIYIIYTKP